MVAGDVGFDLGIPEFLLFVLTTVVVGGIVLGLQWAQGRRSHVSRLDGGHAEDDPDSDSDTN